MSYALYPGTKINDKQYERSSKISSVSIRLTTSEKDLRLDEIDHRN